MANGLFFSFYLTSGPRFFWDDGMTAAKLLPTVTPRCAGCGISLDKNN
jgi:hypothetical protein